MPKRKIISHKALSELNKLLFKEWMAVGVKAIKHKGFFTCVLSGGKTPIEFYGKLASFQDKDFWSKTHIFLADERFLGLKDRNSNFRMIRELLVKKIPIPQENIHPMLTDTKRTEESALRYEKNIKEFFELPADSFPQFDFVLLGIGEDGHTASLFPLTHQLKEQSRMVIAGRYPKVKFERISLTLPVLNNAGYVAFLVTGEKKAKIIKRVLNKEAIYPAAQVRPIKGKLSFFIDKEASAQLD